MKAKPLHALAAAALLPPIACASLQPHTAALAWADSARARTTTTLDAASSETFSIPDVVFDDVRFGVAGMDGATVAPDAVQLLKTRAVVEHRLAAARTCRFSTGHRPGAVFRTCELDGRIRSSRDASGPPPAGGALLRHVQSPTRAGPCVSAGVSDTATLTSHDEGLAIVPLPHPADLSAGERVVFEVRFDGCQPPGQKVEVGEAIWTSGLEPHETSLPTDAQGRVRLPRERAGTVLALVRHRRPAPVPDYSNRDTPGLRVLEQ